MGKGGVLAAAAAACVAVGCLSAPPALAQTGFTLIGDIERVGSIDMLVIGQPNTVAVVFERIDGRLHRVMNVALNQGSFVFDVGRWRCDRLERHFLVQVRQPNGVVDSETYDTRTPSCRHRFLLRLPRRGRATDGAGLTVIDRWGAGDIRPQVCLSHARERIRCRGIPFETDQTRATRQLDLPRPGRWNVELRVAGFRIRRGVEVRASKKSVLRGPPARLQLQIAGDSMIINLDSALIDRLGGEAEIRADRHIGTGLAKPIFNWIAQARRHVRLHGCRRGRRHARDQ